MRDPQAAAGVAAPPLAPQPLAVEQVRAGELGNGPGSFQVADRLLVAVFGVSAGGQQRTGAGEQLPGLGLRQTAQAQAGQAIKQQRPLPGDISQERQHAKTRQETVLRAAAFDPEELAQRIPLGPPGYR